MSENSYLQSKKGHRGEHKWNVQKDTQSFPLWIRVSILTL